MTTSQTDMTPEEARQALSWLIAMGADEIVLEEPVDRFAAPPAAKTAAPAAAIVPAAAPVASPSPASDCKTIEELASALASLEESPLRKTASNLCFSGGNLAGHTMVVGDVAGRDEDLEGTPFAGTSAVLLSRMLASVGLTSAADAPPSQAVSLFNLIPWRPPGNRPVTPQEVEQCLPYLRRAIEIVQPRFILCFGGLPAQALLGRSDSLMAMRGKLFQLELGGRRIPVISTFAPRMLLQQRAQKRLAWRDLLTLQEAMS